MKFSEHWRLYSLVSRQYIDANFRSVDHALDHAETFGIDSRVDHYPTQGLVRTVATYSPITKGRTVYFSSPPSEDSLFNQPLDWSTVLQNLKL